MTETVKTLTLNELIENLQEIAKTKGNSRVVISRDEEGNGFGTLGSDTDTFFKYGVSVDNGLVILWPVQEYVELDQIEGYTEQ